MQIHIRLIGDRMRRD